MKNLKISAAASFVIDLQSEGESIICSAFDVERNRVFFASSAHFVYGLQLPLSHRGRLGSKTHLSTYTERIILEPDDSVVAMDYLMEKEALLIGTLNGCLILLTVDIKTTEIVGRVEGGVKNISSSPDGALLAVTAGLGQLLVMTHDWEVLYETELDQPLCDNGIPGDMDDYSHNQFGATISWRGDGKYLATLGGLHNSFGLQKIRIWERESGTLHSSSESKKFMGASLDWMPSGAKLVAAYDRKHEDKPPLIVFFEKNGLERNSFSIDEPVEVNTLKWNCNSELLAASVSYDTHDAINVWSFSNYHWYLKQEIRYSKLDHVKFVWDPTKPLQLLCWTCGGKIMAYNFVWATAITETSTALVIDNCNVLITPLSLSLMPPPLSLFTLKFCSAVQDITYIGKNSKNYFAACLSDGNLCIIELPRTDSWEQFEGKEFIAEAASSDLKIGTFMHLTWLDSHILLGVSCCTTTSFRGNVLDCQHSECSQGYSLIEIELACSEDSIPDSVSSSGWHTKVSKSLSLEGPVISIVRNPAKRCSAFVQMVGGSILEYSSNTGSLGESAGSHSPELDSENGFSSSCPMMKAVSVCDNGIVKPLVFGLDDNSRLHVGRKILCNNCISFSFYSKAGIVAEGVVTHLLLMTKQDLLFIISVDDILHGNLEVKFERRNVIKNQGEENKEYLNIWERGAKLVGVIHGDDAAAILQTNRGNLECIYPRKLVLVSVINALVQQRFKDALFMVRRHRLDFNVIVDCCGWQAFVESATDFVRQVNNLSHITEFVCSIKDQDVMDNLYKNYISIGTLPRARENSQGHGTNSKVSSVLLAIRKALLEHVEESPARELCILTTLARSEPTALEEALARIKVIRELELSGSDDSRRNLYPSSEESLNRVTGKLPLKGDTLLTRKLGILNVIEAMQLPPERVYPLYLAAASDSQEPVVKRGEELLKRKASVANLDESDLIRRLFVLFNGTTGVGNIADDDRVAPANYMLRVRLISVFCRSIAAANSFPSTLQCIFGCIYGDATTSRLKQLGMEFTVWVFKHAVIDQLKLMGPVILSAILKDLDRSSTQTESTARDTKTFAFQAIGLLASRMPHLFRDKTDMAVRLFAALKLEDQSLRLTIQEAVNSLATAYKDSPLAVLNDLESLLLENSQVEQSEVRFCAVRWATSLFDLQHCPSRYICMLGAADTKLDIREMALGGLYLLKDQGQTLQSSSDLKYPALGEMLDYICCHQPKVLYPSELMEKDLIFSSKTYVAMINFLMKCFEVYSTLYSSEGGTNEADSPLVKLCLLLEHAMAFEGSAELHATASKALVEIAFLFPKLIAVRFSERLSWLKSFLGHVDSDTRESASRLLGVACSSISTSAASGVISDLVSSISGKQMLRFENHHGALCALGYVTAECMKESPTVSEALFLTVVNHLVNVIESESAALASVASAAIGHIGLRCPLPALDRNSISAGVLTILYERLSKLLAGNDIKAIQKMVISLGHICYKESSMEHLNSALNLIFGLCRSKIEDILFAAGEALSFIWGGVSITPDRILKSNYSSLSQSSNYLTGEMPSAIITNNPSDTDNSVDSHSKAREMIIKKLFDSLLYSSRKEERCAGTVWLVSLTMYCGHHPKIQQLLPEIQEAFSHLIGEQNDLTQELASQGMSIVYDLGDPLMKQNLVDAIVGTLTGSGKRKRAVKLTEDSEVFQEGAIGEGLGGGKLSTYKELCSLANEMGQPDLLYKFMDLANYQASLNSKRGAAFGFSKIAKQAGDALQPHLRSLIPRLVRYQYDPDKNVQDAMAHIWKSIVSEPKRTVDDYFDPIVEDLLIESGSRLWRSREASCLALADIIQGRKFVQVSKHLRRIWTAAFRAMDDIKETVRSAGDILCRAVSSLTIRLCDVSLTATSDATETMNIVLPFFLVEGIVSKVSSIQKASIAIVMKLSKGAGTAIRPHLPDLVCCMLECLSSLEDQRLNYVEMHAANVGLQSEKLENLRIAVSKDSAMWETLDLCLKVVDAESLDLLVPRLAQLVKSGVGLNTRVGIASFITLLVQKVLTDIKPYINVLSKVTFQAVLDERSGSAKRSFAASCAVILKYTSPSQGQKLIEDTVALHSGDRNSQISCAILLKNYSSFAADVVSGYHAIILPVIFISRFDEDKDISTLYEELWEENSSTERVTLQLYLMEIVNLLCDCLSSSSWASKRKSAKGIRKLSEILGESLASVHHVLLNCLLKEIPGRFWEEKEVILYSIASLSSSCHVAITAEDPATPDIILNAITSACTKKAKSYREAAFSCLQQVIKAFNNPEFFNSVFPMLHDVSIQACVTKPINSSLIPSSAVTDEESVEAGSVSLDKVIDCVTSCLHVARLPDVIEQKNKLIHVFLCSLSPGCNWTVKISVFSSIKELCAKFHPSENIPAISPGETALVCELFHSVAPKVVESIHTVKISQVHTAASECLLEMSKLYKSVPSVQRTKVEFRDELIRLCDVEKNEQAKTLLGKVVVILEELGEENTHMII